MIFETWQCCGVAKSNEDVPKGRREDCWPHTQIHLLSSLMMTFHPVDEVHFEKPFQPLVGACFLTTLWAFLFSLFSSLILKVGSTSSSCDSGAAGDGACSCWSCLAVVLVVLVGWTWEIALEDARVEDSTEVLILLDVYLSASSLFCKTTMFETEIQRWQQSTADDQHDNPVLLVAMKATRKSSPTF